jgi:cytochrome c-type biogenesis protein CcmH/NrfF
MQRLKSSLLLVLVALAALAQTASEKPSMDVRRVAHRLACQCGCKDSVATCSMLECHFSKPAKEKIARMLAEGMSDQAILDSFVKEFGPGVLLDEPKTYGRLVPYAMMGFGLVAIWLFIRKYRKPRPLADAGPTEIDDPALEKYRDQIEKDIAKLE